MRNQCILLLLLFPVDATKRDLVVRETEIEAPVKLPPKIENELSRFNGDWNGYLEMLSGNCSASALEQKQELKKVFGTLNIPRSIQWSLALWYKENKRNDSCRDSEKNCADSQLLNHKLPYLAILEMDQLLKGVDPILSLPAQIRLDVKNGDLSSLTEFLLFHNFDLTQDVFDYFKVRLYQRKTRIQSITSLESWFNACKFLFHSTTTTTTTVATTTVVEGINFGEIEHLLNISISQKLRDEISERNYKQFIKLLHEMVPVPEIATLDILFRNYPGWGITPELYNALADWWEQKKCPGPDVSRTEFISYFIGFRLPPDVSIALEVGGFEEVADWLDSQPKPAYLPPEKLDCLTAHSQRLHISQTLYSHLIQWSAKK